MVFFKIGPDRHSLVPYVPNRDDAPCPVDSPNFTGQVLVRVARYTSKVAPGPHHSPYFAKRQRKYSITFTGRFKPTKPTNFGSSDPRWTSNDVYCWIEMERPLRLPPRIITSGGLAFIHFFDPLFITDGIFKQEPYAGTPVFATFNLIRLDSAPQEVARPETSGDLDAGSLDGSLKTTSPVPSESDVSVDEVEAEKSRQLSEQALHAAADEIGVSTEQLVTLGKKYNDEEEKIGLQSPIIDPLGRKQGVSTPQLLELPPPAAPASPLPTFVTYEDSPPSMKPLRDVSRDPSPRTEILAPKPVHRPGLATPQNGAADKRTPSAPSAPPRPPSPTRTLALPPWPYSAALFDVAEDLKGTIPATIDTVKKRRKYFSNEATRRAYPLDPDTVYTFEMFDQYIDFNRMTIHVGFEVGGRSLFGEHNKIRITFADFSRRHVFFCIYCDPEDF
ncbi:hypothetical protein DFJ74DRAFT_664494 [Hyaloraphidium curvatum]|nr:hypothetical protein DFJ74DRAFT_664494 [Hyaloraphidium curvatum]